MNDHSLSDPRLLSLEARLAASVPQASPSEQQQLLYQCAYAAGQRAAGKTLHRWQVTSAVISVVLLGLGFSLARAYWTPARPGLAPPVAREVTPRSSPLQVEIPSLTRKPAAVDLDAWEAQPSADASFAKELAHFEQTDPHLRSLAVGTLTRAVFAP